MNLKRNEKEFKSKYRCVEIKMCGKAEGMNRNLCVPDIKHTGSLPYEAIVVSKSYRIRAIHRKQYMFLVYLSPIQKTVEIDYHTLFHFEY